MMTLPELYDVASNVALTTRGGTRRMVLRAIMDATPALRLALAFELGQISREPAGPEIAAIGRGYETLMRALRPLGMRMEKPGRAS